MCTNFRFNINILVGHVFAYRSSQVNITPWKHPKTPSKKHSKNPSSGRLRSGQESKCFQGGHRAAPGWSRAVRGYFLGGKGKRYMKKIITSWWWTRYFLNVNWVFPGWKEESSKYKQNWTSCELMVRKAKLII